jgi:hypothetical protein
VLAWDAFVAAGAGIISTATNWATLNFVGPDANLTPSNARPTAHFSLAQLASDLQEMGIRHNILTLHPDNAHELRTAYGADLDDMLESARFTEGMFVNPRVTADVVVVAEAGMVGTVGFEMPLTVEIYDDRKTRSTIVQAFAVPAFAVDRPCAAKRILLPA